jgi:hypothetical protein
MPYGKGLWKKLAEAFGRAVEDPAATKRGRKLVFDSETVKTRPGDVALHGEDTPEQASFKAGMYRGREAGELTHDARVIPDEAKKLFEAYDFDEARAYGPEGAYRRALERTGLEGEAGVPQYIEDFRETYGFDIEGGSMPKYKPGYKKAWNRESESWSDRGLGEAMQDRIKTDVSDAAYKKLRKDGKDLPLNDAFDEEALDMNREELEKQFEEALIESLKKHGRKSNYPDIVDVETNKFIED